MLFLLSLLVKVYSDESISAHSESISKRPQLRTLLDDCKTRDFEVVAVHELSRWSRNLRLLLESFKHGDSVGVLGYLQLLAACRFHMGQYTADGMAVLANSLDHFHLRWLVFAFFGSP